MAEEMAEAPAEEAPESTEPTTEAPAAQPDLSGEIASLHQKIDAIGKPAEEAPPSADQDFIDQLLGPDAEEEAEPEPFRQYAEAESEQQPEGEAELQQLYDALDARQEERFAQAEAEREFERRSNDLNALAEEMPDLKKPEYMGPIQQELNALAERNGNDWIRTDPKLVRALFLSMKAQETADKQRAAEKAAEGDATLEQSAGPGRGGEGDAESEYGDRIVKAGTARTIFT